MLRDFSIQCDYMIEARRPDIVVVNKVCDKEQEKVEKYSMVKVTSATK